MHSISPSALLELYEQTLGNPAPDAYLLHVRGEEFELGDGISASTEVSVDKAWKFLDELFAEPSDSWAEALRYASSGAVT